MIRGMAKGRGTVKTSDERIEFRLPRAPCPFEGLDVRDFGRPWTESRNATLRLA
ncbi:uncharacterized protein CTRU02_212993 [Colletotrichum truncatum]|uniref:Uncharacterized protein n=1 Tax=Colletotrichum truncatum TaxID=5467 RepID=A0ACC3YJG2_COLTU